MSEKTGRNDPCPCGSGKKYKACCFKKTIKVPLNKKKISTLASKAQSVDLMERTFGSAIAKRSFKPMQTPAQQEQQLPEKGHLDL